MTTTQTNSRKKTRHLKWSPEDAQSFPVLSSRRVRGGQNPVGGAYATRIVLTVVDPGERDRLTELLIDPADINYLISRLQHVAAILERTVPDEGLRARTISINGMTPADFDASIA